MKCTRLICGLGPIFILVSIAATISGQEVAPESSVLEANRSEFFAKFGVTDYDSPLLETGQELARRRLKNQRYDNQNWVVKIPSPDIDYVRRVIQHAPLPTFPVEESSVIVTGLVTTVSAHLSNDKTGIYSEYTIRVEQVLKDGSSRNLTPGAEITVDRAGGVVRYPEGQKLAYFVGGKNLPTVGGTYALFLRDDRSGRNPEIVTLYQLKDNSLIPLDDGASFQSAKGTTKSDFVRIVQEKLSKASNN